MSVDDYGRGFACKNVWEKRAPILYVYRESDGDWQFLCAGNEHAPAPDNEHAPDNEIVLIHAEHAFELFPDVRSLSDLKPGHWASRETPKSPWVRHFELK